MYVCMYNVILYLIVVLYVLGGRKLLTSRSTRYFYAIDVRYNKRRINNTTAAVDRKTRRVVILS